GSGILSRPVTSGIGFICAGATMSAMGLLGPKVPSQGLGYQDALCDQFLLRSTSARSLIHGIISRSLAPMASAGCAASLLRMALNDVWLTLFSSIQSLTNLPDWISARIFFISARVASLITRGPETYSPYSAVLETE